MSKFMKISQLPMMEPPAAAPPEPEKPAIILGPLDSIEKILVDSKIEERIADVDKPEDIAIQIWEDYGGKRSGGVHGYAVGKRGPESEKRKIEEAQAEIEANEDKKWERLPRGEKISDVTSIEQISEIIKKSMLSFVKKVKGKNAPPPSGGGMPMM